MGATSALPTWLCQRCTFQNEFIAIELQVEDVTLHCEVCNAVVRIDEVVAQINSTTGKSLCVSCTMLNPSDSDRCSFCGSVLNLAELRSAETGSPPHSFPSEMSFLRAITALSLGLDISRSSTSSENTELNDLMAEFDLMKPEHAENFRTLRADAEFRDCDPQDLAEAVRSCGDRPDYFDFVQRYFNNECPICFEKFPQHKLLQMASCQCKICFRCFYNFVSTNLENNDHVSHLQCPMCNTPNSEAAEALEFHFQLLVNQVISFQHPELQFHAEKISLLEKRLRDWNLMRDPSFRWCSHCPNGMSLSPNMTGLKFRCPNCKKLTCKDCQKPWQDQHAGISCDQFEKWLVENDAEYQEKGVAAYLQCNGIQCPKCQCRFALAKGGCMHFTCRQCRAEFCSGCSGFFTRVNGQGLVCSHPRDCLFYLRDFDVKSLQQLLRSHRVQFETAAANSAAASGICSVMEQKEVDGGRLVDEACGKEVSSGHASLCQKHYTEYLVSLINRNRLDPVEIMDADQLKELCRRHEVKFDPKVANDSGALRSLVVAKVPLRG